MLRLVKVHEHVHLTEQCIALLNDEWPRDRSIRLKTLGKSSDSYPLCLALVDEKENVLGFVKLSSELPFNKSIFLESLVVSKSNRSRGLGRFIMEEVERLVKSSGFDRITLTTVDKEQFYMKMGFARIFDEPPNQKQQQQEQLTSQQTESNGASHFPPPPPLMPPLFCTPTSKTQAKVLMYKNI